MSRGEGVKMKGSTDLSRAIVQRLTAVSGLPSPCISQIPPPRFLTVEGRSYGLEYCFLPSFHQGLGRACGCGTADSGGLSLPPGGNAVSQPLAEQRPGPLGRAGRGWQPERRPSLFP